MSTAGSRDAKSRPESRARRLVASSIAALVMLAMATPAAAEARKAKPKKPKVTTTAPVGSAPGAATSQPGASAPAAPSAPTPAPAATPAASAPAASASASSTSPSASAPEPAPSPSSTAVDRVATSVDEREAWAHTIGTLAAGFQVQSRGFTFHDALGNPKTYDLAASPAVSASGEVFPGAGSGIPVLSDLGLAGDFTMGLGLSSAPPGGQKVDSSWTRWNAGLRGRMRIGGARTLVLLGITGGVGQESFSFSGSAPDLPDVSYTYLRAMLDANVPVGPVILSAQGGYLPVLSAGDVADRYRGTRVGGVEGGLSVRAPFARHFDARITADYTRYFYAFEPRPGDKAVAGGALDQMMRAQVALAASY